MWDRLFGHSHEKGYVVLESGDSVLFQEVYAPPGAHFKGGTSKTDNMDPSSLTPYWFYGKNNAACSFAQEDGVWSGTITISNATQFFDVTPSSRQELTVFLALTGDEYPQLKRVCNIKVFVTKKITRQTGDYLYLLRTYGQEELGMQSDSSLTEEDTLYTRILLQSTGDWVLAAADALDRMAAEGYTSFRIGTEGAADSFVVIHAKR